MYIAGSFTKGVQIAGAAVLLPSAYMVRMRRGRGVVGWVKRAVEGVNAAVGLGIVVLLTLKSEGLALTNVTWE